MSPLFALVILARKPIVAWLPVETRSMPLFAGEFIGDRRVVELVIDKATRTGFPGRFDTPNAGRWQIAQRGAHDRRMFLAAAKRVGADILALPALRRFTTKEIGFDTGLYTLTGTLTLIDARRGREIATPRPVSARIEVAGPSATPVGVRIAAAFAQKLKEVAASLVGPSESVPSAPPARLGSR